MLHIKDLFVDYGSAHALSGVSISVAKSAFVALVGPNGAGKTTLFKAISGIVTSVSGLIEYDGIDLSTVRASARAGLGIAHVPEGRQVFKSMTVLENLEMGGLRAPSRADWSTRLQQIYDLFPILSERKDQLAGALSGGQQQMLAIGRGLALAPRLLMLDEPSMGLAPATADLIFEKIQEIHRIGGISILLVEQRVAEALESCDQGYVLDTGRIVMSGSHDTLIKNPQVKKSYFGT